MSLIDIMSRIWRGIGRMLGYKEIKRIIGRDVALSQEMIDAISEWSNMMNGDAIWTTDYVRSLRIEHGICREFADVVLTEMESSISNKRLNDVYQKAVVGLNENLQEGIGLGSFILKPLGGGRSEFVEAGKFIPIHFDGNGKPDDCAFISVKKAGDNQYYTKIERHSIENGFLVIRNQAYFSESKNDIGRKVSLSDMDEWSKIPEERGYPGMTKMDFGYYRNPVKNRIDGSLCGVSIFESEKELIKKADIQGARLDWEYESGERAIHVDERALRKKNETTSIGKLNKRLYRGLNIEDGKDKELFKDYSPEMRDEAYHRGLERYLRQIEFNVGLSYGDLSDVQEVEKTAAEIKASKQRKYNRVNAIQEKLRECLEDFADGLAFWEGLYTSGYEFSCTFNDSILTDEEAERQQDRSDMAIGVMSKLDYRMKWYQEDEEEAKKHITDSEGVIE